MKIIHIMAFALGLFLITRAFPKNTEEDVRQFPVLSEHKW